jgi:hypothetical protein
MLAAQAFVTIPERSHGRVRDVTTPETRPRRTAQRARVLAWGLTGLALSLTVATLVISLLHRADSGGRSDGASLVGILFLALPLTFSAVGGLLAVRRPENSVGWLCLAIGLLWSLEGVGYEGAGWAGDRGMLAFAAWIGLLGSAWLPAVGVTGAHLALRLPGGSLPSARWRWYSRACTAVIVAVGLVVVTEPGRVADVAGTQNPIGSEALQSLSPLFALLPLCVLGAIASLVLRYRRAAVVERLQIRWIALGGVLFLVAVLLIILLPLLGLVAENSASDVEEGGAYVAYGALPVAIAIAVLRHRLYDIDVVINRALVYGALTATLAAVYVACVLLLQLALRPLTRDLGLAVAASTLAVAALFRPARARIQAGVDRRFFRHKYDAAKTLERFSAHLRDEIDLDSLSDELRGIVHETMQPVQVSLWLRAGPPR